MRRGFRGLGQPSSPLPLAQGGFCPTLGVACPVIGTIDLTNPMEWLFFGGALASLVLAKSGTSKLAGAAGFIGARFILEQTGANV